MLNMNSDLDIQDYVTVDFGAIADAVDLLGGIEIEVTEEELPYINQYIPETANSAGKAANLLQSAGLQKLDGTQATTYARNSFYGRRRFYSYGASAPCNRKNV